MDKIDVIQKIKREKIISVIRSENQEEIEKIIDSIVAGGVHLIEITMTVPNAVGIIEGLVKKYKNTDVTIGAGTVLDAETAKLVINAGAEFVVSPIFDKDLMKMCNRYRVLMIPGIATPTEANVAMEHGADIVKLFPRNAYGPEIIKVFRGPFPYIQIIPTGNISLEDSDKWVKNGAIAIGVGGEIVNPAKKGDFDKTTEMARAFIEKVNS
jgi:2-dehydro-3-deoxyphosphogluconate aldolase/(4S)-4-hydroxy-2-oxoglutarate aldolase